MSSKQKVNVTEIKVVHDSPLSWIEDSTCIVVFSFLFDRFGDCAALNSPFCVNSTKSVVLSCGTSEGPLKVPWVSVQVTNHQHGSEHA